jgi:4-carboxymuconolactone decarboxylase
MTLHRSRRLRPDELSPDQAELYRAITGGPRRSGVQHFALTDEDGSLNGPFNAFLLDPAVGTALQGLGSALRYRGVVADRIRELAILMTATRHDCAFEWTAHRGAALAAGLSDETLNLVARGDAPVFTDESDIASVAVIEALLDGDIDDALWSETRDLLGEQVIFELSSIVGYYSLLALQLRIFRVG